ncbi:MAG: hypothetical protein HDS97_08060 [Bacteroidales bacterium]|nr:hypothetical protein [Bacteroidales bacterium]
MGRYFYPSASDALSAKKQFLREHGYKIPHCFKNSWGSGYVLFDSKSDVNSWYKEHTGEFFYKEEYESGTIFTKQDAYREIDKSYGEQIEEVIRLRDFSFPKLALGLPSIFGNRMFLKFVLSSNESDIEGKFYIHYDAFIIDASKSVSTSSLRDRIKDIIYKHFYNSYFKKRIEGSAQELERRDRAKRAAMAERDRIEKERKCEQQRLEQERIRKQREQQEESKPKINSLTISSNPCFVGENVVLKWDTQNCDKVYLNGQLQSPNYKTKTIKYNNSGSKKLTLRVVKGLQEVSDTLYISVISRNKVNQEKQKTVGSTEGDKKSWSEILDIKEKAEDLKRDLKIKFELPCLVLSVIIGTLILIWLPSHKGENTTIFSEMFSHPFLETLQVLLGIVGLYFIIYIILLVLFAILLSPLNERRIRKWKKRHPKDPRSIYL